MIYDDLGNITSLKRGLYQSGTGSLTNNVIQDWHYGYNYGGNQLLSVDSINSLNLRDYSYDMNGNMTYQTAGKSKTTTGYMRSNLPQKTVFRADTTDAGIVLNAKYAYNAQDDRVYKELEIDGQYKRSYSLRDAMGKELGEYEMDDTTWTHYAYGRDRIAEYKDGETANYYVYDHLGSVRVMYGIENCNTTPDYVIKNASDYYAFGKTLRSFNSGKYHISGKESDKEIGLECFGARNYDADIARWTSADPSKEKYPSLSPYNYCANNPIAAIDPDGKDIIFLITLTNSDATGDNNMFVKSAQTRKYDVEHSQGFDPTKDIVVYMNVENLADLQGLINKQVDALSGKYGNTREVGVYSHNGRTDGPIASETTANSYEIDQRQMTPAGWGQVNWNWKGGTENTCTFYGCHSALEENGKNFSKQVSGEGNMKNVKVRGQSMSSYPSLVTDKRYYTEGLIKGDFSKVFKLYMVGSDGGNWDAIFNGAYPLLEYVNGEYKGQTKQEGRTSIDFYKKK